MKNMAWFTNLDTTKRHELLTLYKSYTPEEYPRYDNYDAIEVPRYADIPYDFNRVMGVPITFLDKYNPDQFEIVGTTESTIPTTICGPGGTRRRNVEMRTSPGSGSREVTTSMLPASSTESRCSSASSSAARKCRCENRTEGSHRP